MIKGDLHLAEEPLYKQFDAKYELYKNRNISGFNQALQMVQDRELIMYENRQTLEYRIRKDFTNK